MKEVIRIPELAAMLDTTEAAIRSAIQRKSKDIPVSFMYLGKRTWRRATVEQFLRDKEQASIEQNPQITAKKRGRPRLVPQVQAA